MTQPPGRVRPQALHVEVPAAEPQVRIEVLEEVADLGAASTEPACQPFLAKPGRRLTEGDRVGSLEVVAAPGHTPGHVAFLDTRDGALIGGDVFTTYGRTEVTHHFYWRFPFAAWATEDGAVAADWARKLRALEPSLLLDGHGAAVRQPVAAMDAALTRLWYSPH